MKKTPNKLRITLASRRFPLSVSETRYSLLAQCNCSLRACAVSTLPNVTRCVISSVRWYINWYIGTVSDVWWGCRLNTSCWYSFNLWDCNIIIVYREIFANVLFSPLSSSLSSSKYKSEWIEIAWFYFIIQDGANHFANITRGENKPEYSHSFT